MYTRTVDCCHLHQPLVTYIAPNVAFASKPSQASRLHGDASMRMQRWGQREGVLDIRNVIQYSDIDLNFKLNRLL